MGGGAIQMRSRLCNGCKKWSPVDDWGYGCPTCGHTNGRGEASYSEYPGVLVMNDIRPYQSMIDGSEITSRSRHREHLRQHGCVEVGNDSSLTRKPQPLKSPAGLKETIIRTVNHVEEMQRRSKCH